LNTEFDKNVANEQKWSHRAATYDDKRHDYFRFMQSELIGLAGVKAGCNFLDLGCGTGWAVCYAAGIANGSGRFVGIDISKGMIDKARSNAQGQPKVEFYEASADKLPLEADIFDTVICTNSFHHYPRPEAALSEVKRVLKPQGKIYILDVTADDFFIRWVNERVRDREKEHVKFYGSKEYAAMFGQVGLKHVASRMIKILYPLKVHIGEKNSITP
jgi:ubiquinone/menaquinone biosynthesis C-methylase UbiE